MRYQPNPKHKEPWQPGRKGTLCPPADELSLLEAARLLQKSETIGKKRYNVHNGKAYCAQSQGGDLWHGYPVPWSEVPYSIRKKWRDNGLVKRREMKENRG